MKIDITSLCFGFKITKENDSGTPAWATSIGQAPKEICYIDTDKEGLDELVYGMMYKSHSDYENLQVRDIPGVDKREEPRGNRERMMFSVFEDVYVNNIKLNGSYVLTYEREDTSSHKNRLHICYAKYLTYKGHSNKSTLIEMAETLGCTNEACWFVSDINVKNQSQLHFRAIVVNSTESVTYPDSSSRNEEWNLLANPIITNEKYNQTIYYGTPGSGKSWTIKKFYEMRKDGEKYVKDVEKEKRVIRTTFHPDTDYASFVGCYKPTKDLSDNKKITYEFVPQAFVDAYVKAWKNLGTPYYLVIEEINRGNCAQIFGDLFQLLDRNKEGYSEYPIKADSDLRQYLEENLPADSLGIRDGKLCLPPNLNIIASMNTSDQSLFPMDSAFKRRWNWEYVPIDYKNAKSGEFTITLGEDICKWHEFLKAVNKEIKKVTASEDKQMGNFFIKNSIDEKEFCDKVMFYLWSEVGKDNYKTNEAIFKWRDENDNDTEFSFNELYPAGENRTKILKGFIKYIKEVNKQENSAE